MEQDDLERVGVSRAVEDQVAALARIARTAGLDGVVASAREVKRIRATCGKDLLVVTPGIRPSGSVADDQARTLTPRAAIEAGADCIVVGRPIIRADDPLEAAETILLQMDAL